MTQHTYIDPIIDQIDKYSITSLQQLKSLVETRSNNNNYKFSTLKIGYQMVCKKCDAFLKFSILNKNLIVASKNSLHIHKKNKLEGEQSKNKNQGKERTMIIQESNIINDSKNNKKIIFPTSSYTKLIQQLKKNQYEHISLFQSLNNNQLSGLFLISPNMAKNYKLYGEVMHFELISNKFQFQNQIFDKLILFYGWDQSMSAIIFGYGFIKGQDPNKYQVILSQFITLMNKSPQVIIIFNDHFAINESIDNLIASGIYAGKKIFNWCKILNQLKMQLNNQKVKLYEKLILSDDINEFNSIMLKIQKGIANEQQFKIYSSIRQNSELICKSKLNDTFLGIFNQYNLKLREDVIENIISENQIIQVINIIHKLDRKLNQSQRQFQKIQFQKYFCVNKLKNLRRILYKSVFSKFIQNFFYRCNFQVIQINPKHFKVSEFNSKIQFQIVIQGKNYCCQCQQLQKQGLPCSHIIRVIEYKRGNIQNVINKRWICSTTNVMKGDKDNQDESIREIN